jgi:hypothetical protein
MSLEATELRHFVRESNRIEGITREPTKHELEAHITLLAHGAPDIGAVRAFVWTVAGKPLRDRPGMNVRVGNHIAPPGGPEIVTRLGLILHGAHRGDDPYDVHRDYETLHPFLDGNGRSGRAIWLWQMLHQRNARHVLQLGFLHCWYYQSLAGRG